MVIEGFGKIKEKKIDFSEGLNIVFGKNEAGKSTIQGFIKAVLFGLGKEKRDGISEKNRYKPWNGNLFAGSVEYYLDNAKKFRIWRDFSSGQDKVFDDGLNDITALFSSSRSTGVQIAQEQLGISKDMFEKTCFITQNGLRLSHDSEINVWDKMANTLETGNEDISYSNVKKNLEKILIEEVGTERTFGRPFNVIKKKIQETNLKIEENKNVSDRIKALEEELKTLKEKEKIVKKQKIVLGVAMKDLTEDSSNSDAGNKDLNYQLAERKNELEKIESKVPKGLDIFDEDIAARLLGLEKEIKGSRSKGWMFGTIGNSIVIIIGIMAFLFYPSYIFFEIAFVLAGIMGIGIGIRQYLNSFSKKNEEYLDILATAQALDFSDYNKKKKEVLFLIEKKKLVIQSIELLQTQKTILESPTESPELRRIELRKKEVETEIRLLSDKTEKTVSLEEELENLKRDEKELEEYSYCVKTALSLIRECNQSLKEGWIPNLFEKVSENTEFITGKYSEVILGAGDEGIRATVEGGNVVPIGMLSGATIDQIYFSLRLSSAQAISEKGEKLPLVFDESFSHFDEERLTKVIEMLDKISATNQIILFTCKEDEIKIVNKKASKANIICI